MARPNVEVSGVNSVEDIRNLTDEELAEILMGLQARGLEHPSLFLQTEEAAIKVRDELGLFDRIDTSSSMSEGLALNWNMRVGSPYGGVSVEAGVVYSDETEDYWVKLVILSGGAPVFSDRQRHPNPDPRQVALDLIATARRIGAVS